MLTSSKWWVLTLYCKPPIFVKSSEYGGCGKVVQPCPDACSWLSIVMQKEDAIDWRDLAPSNYHLFDPMKKGLRGKHYASDKEVKTAVMKWFKEQSIEFYEARRFMLSFENETLLLRETVTMLRSRDVIHWGPASFWCMIHVPVSVIIPVLKKKALLFYSPSYVCCYNCYGTYLTDYDELFLLLWIPGKYSSWC